MAEHREESRGGCLEFGSFLPTETAIDTRANRSDGRFKRNLQFAGIDAHDIEADKGHSGSAKCQSNRRATTRCDPAKGALWRLLHAGEVFCPVENRDAAGSYLESFDATPSIQRRSIHSMGKGDAAGAMASDAIGRSRMGVRDR